MRTIPPGTDDAALVAAAIRGDDDAFRRIVDRHQGVVRGLLRRLARDHDVAEDLAQNTFVKAWQKLETWHGGSLRSWLCAIGTRMWLQLHRRSALPFADDEPDSVAIAEGDVGREMDLDRALACLGREQRVVMLLSYSVGMSHSEIVAATGWPLGTVKSHISRGKQKLQQLLEAYAG